MITYDHNFPSIFQVSNLNKKLESKGRRTTKKNGRIWQKKWENNENSKLSYSKEMMGVQRKQNQKLRTIDEEHNQALSDMQKLIEEWRKIMEKQCEITSMPVPQDVLDPSREGNGQEYSRRQLGSTCWKIENLEKVEVNGETNGIREGVNEHKI